MIQRREVVLAYVCVATCAVMLGCKQSVPPSVTAAATVAAVQGQVFAAPSPDDLFAVVPDAGPPPITATPFPRTYLGIETGVCSPLDYAWKAPGCKGSI